MKRHIHGASGGKSRTLLSLINKRRGRGLKAALEMRFCANLLTGVDRQRLKNIGGGFPGRRNS